MTITHQGQGQFTVKSKDATIILGSKIKIGDRELPGAGEYEVSGVEVEGMEDGIYLLRTEDVYLLYLNQLNRQLTNDELETVNMADILFLPVGGDKTDTPELTVLNPEQSVKVINQVDPRIVVPMHFLSIEPFRAAEGKPLEMMKEFKVTKAGLPQEERQIVVLTQ